MFDRWFKPKGPPVPLDLTKHRPPEYQGKSVTLNGRDYLIGGKVRDTDQGYAHRLTNSLSGLSLHVIQIRKESVTHPEQAWLASKEKQDVTAKMRDQFLSEGKPNPISVVMAWQAHGGSFEVHEIVWGMMGSDGEQSALREVSLASAHREKGDHTGAVQMLEGVLLQHPHHTVALANLASAYDALGHNPAALDAMTKAADCEPNYSHYLGAQLQLAVNSQRRRQAVPYYEKLRQRYPLIRDFCLYGVHAYLRAGLPDRAQEALLGCPLVKEQAEALVAMVAQAIQARQRMSQIEAARFSEGGTNLSKADLLAEFEEIYASNQIDPRIQANFGFLLRQTGEHRRAAALLMSAGGGIDDKLLAHCWANAAYCLLELSDWDAAFKVLSAVMGVLRSFGGEVAPADVPGLANWITDGGAVSEDIAPPAFEVLDRGIANCPDQSLITPEIHDMARLLRQFSLDLQRSSGAL